MSDARHGKDGDEDTVEGLRAQRDQLAAELVAARRELARMSTGFAMAADGTGPLPAVQGQRQPASHRVPKEARWLKVVPVILLLAAGVRAALRWAAHHAAVTAAAVTGGGGLVIATAAFVTAPAQGGTAQAPGGNVSAPAAGIYDADPMTSSPAAPAKPKTAVRKARPIVVQEPPDGPPSLPAPSATPSATAPSPSAPPPFVTPQLTVAAGLDLGVYMVGHLTIGNPQDQAVTWSADCGQDVALLPAFGVLMPGQQGFQVQVQVNPIDGMSGGLCVFSPGNERLTVTWAGAGAPSAGL